MYHPSVIAASLDLTRAGSAGPGAAWGEAGDPSCGDAVRIELAVTDGLVVRARHSSFACPHATAAASLACRLSEGRDLLAAATIGSGELESELRPEPHNRECVALAADALHAAIARALDRERMPVRADRVAVAMSGGVDSAVALLKALEAGLQPVGVTLRLWIDPDAPDSDRACCSPQSVRAARSACHATGVHHVTLDLRDRFRSQVVDDFVRGHAAGTTPNPCMRCNGSFRFDALAAFADRVGAPRLATGHYARIVERGGHTVLARGADPDKDQSYMLARVPEQILSRTWFPLGDQRKTDTREQAHAAGVVTADGHVIGRHDGVHRFTPGQRKGLGVGGGEALFVLEVDPARGRVVAGPRRALARSTVTVRPGTMVLPMARVQAKLRYRSPALPATVREVEGGLELRLDEPAYGVAPGQAAVLYDGDVIVGGGVIAG